MMGLPEYLLKASICITLIYGFYRLAFQQEKTLQFNRIYLLAGLFVCLVLPALNPTLYLPDLSNYFNRETAEAAPVLSYTYLMVEDVSGTETIAEKTAWNWPVILITAYLAVSMIFLLVFLVNLTRIVFRIIDSPKRREGSFIFVLTNSREIPHSFLNYIFVNIEDYESGAIRSEIIRHEKVHGSQWHTMDILFAELAKIVFWFHPVIWLFKRSMQLNHEFLADNTVLKDYEIKAYQKALVDYAYRNQAVALVSNFNYSFTKKRLMMMTRMKTNKWRFGSKLALLLPVLMLAFLVSATCQTKEEPPVEKKMTQKEQVEAQKQKEAKAQAEYEMEQVKKEMEQAKKEIETAKQEIEEQKKVIKQKKIILDGEGADIEAELEEVMKQLEKDLEGLDLDMEKLMEDIKKGIDIDLEQEIDGGKKRIKVITGGMDGNEFEYDYDFDFDFEFEDGEDMEKIKKVIKVHDGDKKVMFIGEDGEIIELKGDHGDHDIKVIHKEHIDGHEGDDGNVWIHKGEGHGDHDGEVIIKIKSDGDDEEIHKIIKKEIHDDIQEHHGNHTIKIIEDDGGKKVEKIIIMDGGEEMEWIEDGVEKQIEVIVIKEDGGKSKKKKKKNK